MRLGLLVLVVMVAMAGEAAAQARANIGLVREGFAPAVARVAPAVVNIFAERKVPSKGVVPNPSAINDPLMRELLGGPANTKKQRMQQSLGSGVMVRSDGVFVTNYHVIEGASDVQVVTADGREYPVKFVNADPKLDLAVLRLQLPPGETVPVAPFGNSDSLRMGDVVLAIGNPFGLGQSVSMGVVSAVGRSNANLSEYGQFIQTDATINPGNSGGALVDSNGLVVGINTAIFSRSGGSMGIGFAVPANLVQAVVKDIVTTGRVERPWLGAVGQNVSVAVARELGLPAPSGVLIAEIVPDSPAARSELKVGDVMVSLNGVPITDPANLNERIVTMNTLLDAPVPAEVWRAGVKTTVMIPFAVRPERKASDRATIKTYNPLTGFTLEQMTPALALELGVPLRSKGIVIVGLPDVPSTIFPLPMQLMKGDVLTHVNGQAVMTLEEAQAALDVSKRRWSLTLKRGTKVLNVVTGN